MRDRLRIGCYDIVIFIGQVHEARLQRPENALDQRLRLVTRPMLNDDLRDAKMQSAQLRTYLRGIKGTKQTKMPQTHKRLSQRRNRGPMQRMARDYLHIFRQVFFEGSALRGLDRSLPGDDGANFTSYEAEATAGEGG